jgi:hypothetical protein
MKPRQQRSEHKAYSRDVGFDIKVEYSGTDPLYVGRAYSGALITEAKWQIYKIAVDGSGNITSMRWADNTDDFDKIWNDKGDYDYGDI